MNDAFQLAVLNAAGRDPRQLFPDAAGTVDDGVHAPVNYHAYAACTRGGFYREIAELPAGQKAVLLLLRRDLKPALVALKKLKERGCTVAISWKESGLHQVASQLAEPKAMVRFQEICGLADGGLSSTGDLVPLYRAAGAKVVEFIPTPYPVEDARWDFSEPLAERSGIFIGTREFEVPSRNHLAALALAKLAGGPVTVFNVEGRRDRLRLESLGIPQLRIIEGKLPYSQYLREMAKHRVVLQLDRSGVPGQVAGDALLCRMPCVGGDGAVEQAVFEETCGSGRSLETLGDVVASLLQNDGEWQRVVKASQVVAGERLSFVVGAVRLREFFDRLGL
ncbi:MAG: hypothetical protein QM796_02310 [Chthoniobacteraceae bacterium]